MDDKEFILPERTPWGFPERLDLAKGLRWQSPEKSESDQPRTNKSVIEEAVSSLSVGNDEAKIKLNEEVTKMRVAANDVYKSIYAESEALAFEALNQPYYHGIEPWYHGIGSENDWDGHNDFVAAVSARLFEGLVNIQRCGTAEEKQSLDQFFGLGWQEEELTLDDFKSLMAMAFIHEAGEWWVRGYWEDVLKAQREEFKLLDAEDIRNRKGKITSLQDIAKAWKSDDEKKDLVNQGIKNTQETVTQVNQVLGSYGIKTSYDPDEDPTGFKLDFATGNFKSLDFTSELIVDGSKTSILTRLLRAADFAQVLSPGYQKKVNYVYQDASGQLTPKTIHQGVLVLYDEFLAFKPSALILNGWAVLEDAQTSLYFWNNFIKPNTINESVWLMLQKVLNSKSLKSYLQRSISSPPNPDPNSSSPWE